MSTHTISPAHEQLIQMGTAYWVSRAVYAAARLGLADLLSDGSRTAAELAAATGTHAPSLHRLMRTLASLGLFTTVGAQRFSLTPLGAALKSGAPGAARSTILALAGEWIWRAWSEFLHSLETGETGMERAWGEPLFPYLAKHPEEARYFGEAMGGIHGDDPPAVAAAYDFTDFRTIVDVGGGSGHLLAAILNANPHLRGVLYDLPHVAPEAQKYMESAGLKARCEVLSGDFFAAVPSGSDAYLLSHIIHDWDERRCGALLRHCRRAMDTQGRLLIVEAVLPAGDAPHPGKVLDLVMLTVPGGMERTEEEYAALLAKASFRLTRIVPTASPVSIVEAIPA
jgi:hypothetical protein